MGSISFGASSDSGHPNLSIEPLSAHHDRAVFTCGAEPLDRYIRQQAGQDARKNVAATFALVEADQTAVLGFYTLSATSVLLGDSPESTARKLPRYPQVPAILMGRLAVDRSRRGRGYGELLLMDAIKRCHEIKNLGWVAVIVDAKDESAVRFYEHFHFIRFLPDSNRLFLPRATVESLLK